MVFPAIPATGNSTLLTSQAVGTGTARTFPSLTSLAKGSGDLMVAVIVAYQASATNATFSGWGGGFTEFADTGNSATPTTAIGAAYKWSDGTETGTFTVTQAATITGDAVMFLMAIPGAHPSVAPAAGALATGTTGAANPASFTSGFGARDTLWIAVCGSSETSTTSSYTGCASAPANYTGYAEAGMTQDAVGACDGSVSFRQLNAAAEDVGTAGVDTSNARNAALVLAVRPAVDTLQAAGAAEGGGGAQDATAYTQDGVVSSTESLDTVSVQVLYVPPPAITPAAASGAGAALDARAGALVTVTPGSADGAGETPFGAGYSASLDLIADDAVTAAGEALNAAPATAHVTTVTPAAADGAGTGYDAATATAGPVTPASADGTGTAHDATPVTAGGGTLAPPWVGTAAGATSGATSATLDYTAAAAGDWLYAVIGLSDRQASNPTAPAGWEIPSGGQGGEGSTGSPSSCLTVYRRRKQAGDTTQAFTWGTSCGYAAVPFSYPGDATTASEGWIYQPHSSGSTYPTGTVTPTAADRWIAGVFYLRGSTATGTWTADAAMTERDDHAFGTNPYNILQLADTGAAVTAAGHAYTSTCTTTSSHGGSVAWALIPGAAAPATVTVIPGSADGGGAAYDAAVTTASTAAPAQAGGAGTGYDPAVTTASTVTAILAAGTGLAYDAAVTAPGAAAPASADAAGTAYDPAVTGTGLAGPAPAGGTGTAYDAAPSTAASVTVTAGSADGTGTGYDAAVTTASTATATAASGAGAAYDITPVTAGTTYVQPAQADAAALAHDGAASGSGTGIPAGADGTGQGLDAGATSASMAAPATASAAAPAYDATPAVTAAGQVLAGGAAADGTAYDAGWTASGNAPATAAADGTGQGLDAAPTAVAYTNVTAASADGTGAAYQPAWTASGAATPGSADAAGLAYDSPPGGSASIPAGSADAMGAAWPPTPVYARLTLPGSADGAGTALDAAICITIAIDAAEAAGQALAAYIPPQVVFGRSVPGTATAEHAEAGGRVLATAAAGGGLIGSGTPGSG